MQLFFNQTSPYARKARVAVHELGLTDKIAFVEVDPWAEPEALTSANPLSKVPALLLPGGRLVTESDTIIEVLSAWTLDVGLIPADLDGRCDALARAALSQGLIDASFISVIEGRRPEPMRWKDWVARQERAIARTLAAIGAAFDPPAGRFDIGDIGLATALAYLDFRLPHIGWRAAHPRLAAWLDEVATRKSMIATRPA
jgi:glutathione S-transferase